MVGGEGRPGGPAGSETEAEDPRRGVINEHLKTLKLPAFAREYAILAERAREKSWDFEDFLRELLAAEIASRRKSTAMRRLRAAQFPSTKTLDQIDWQALRGFSRLAIARLARCEYIKRAEDVVLLGPTGTGKTHLAIGLGIEATQRRYRVLFRRAADLVRELLEARDERELGRFQSRLQRVDLLICDELGFVPLGKEGGEVLFNVLTERCERRSTLVTTDLPFRQWAEVFGSARRAAALSDRLSAGAHLLTTSGESRRGRSRREDGD